MQRTREHAKLPSMHIDNSRIDSDETSLILAVHGSENKLKNASKIVSMIRKYHNHKISQFITGGIDRQANALTHVHV